MWHFSSFRTNPPTQGHIRRATEWGFEERVARSVCLEERPYQSFTGYTGPVLDRDLLGRHFSSDSIANLAAGEAEEICRIGNDARESAIHYKNSRQKEKRRLERSNKGPASASLGGLSHSAAEELDPGLQFAAMTAPAYQIGSHPNSPNLRPETLQQYPQTYSLDSDSRTTRHDGPSSWNPSQGDTSDRLPMGYMELGSAVNHQIESSPEPREEVAVEMDAVRDRGKIHVDSETLAAPLTPSLEFLLG